MVATARHVPVAALVLVALCGCGGGPVIRTAAQGDQYLDDVTRGASASGKLADDATIQARLAFAKAEDVDEIRALHDEAEEGSSSWVCDAIGVVSDGSDFIPPPNGIEDLQDQLEGSTEVGTDDADALLEALRGLAGSDVTELVDAMCDSGF